MADEKVVLSDNSSDLHAYREARLVDIARIEAKIDKLNEIGKARASWTHDVLDRTTTKIIGSVRNTLVAGLGVATISVLWGSLPRSDQAELARRGLFPIGGTAIAGLVVVILGKDTIAQVLGLTTPSIPSPPNIEVDDVEEPKI